MVISLVWHRDAIHVKSMKYISSQTQSISDWGKIYYDKFLPIFLLIQFRPQWWELFSHHNWLDYLYMIIISDDIDGRVDKSLLLTKFACAMVSLFFFSDLTMCPSDCVYRFTTHVFVTLGQPVHWMLIVLAPSKPSIQSELPVLAVP